MGEKDSSSDRHGPSGESTADDEAEFLGAGPEESLEMNSSAEEAFSVPKSETPDHEDSDEPLELDPDEVLEMNPTADEAFSPE